MTKRILFTDFRASVQKEDLTDPPNCDGFGRVRHFRRDTTAGWPQNPLPIDPAIRSLALPATDLLRAQAFQVAACNWRCWYCFVPFDTLTANPKKSKWFSVAELLDLYAADPSPPRVIDLTGGEPSLVPEWVCWTMAELRNRGLHDEVYVWSDDNLSNDYFWDVLSDAEREVIFTYPHYGRVCCFKGYDKTSFQFNTGAEASSFDLQFSRMRRLIDTSTDLYAYVTFTTPVVDRLEENVARFVDRLQEIDANLPLRTVPLEIKRFTPVLARLDVSREMAIGNQQRVVEVWTREIEARFSDRDRLLPVYEVPMRRQGRS